MPIALLAVILGLIQAATEFLPVSSSAHLILARAALDFDVVDGLTFDVAVHIGTLIAIVVYFWGDLRMLARGFLQSVSGSGMKDPASRLAWYIVAACVPAGLVGFFLEHAIELYFRHPSVIVVTLIAGALLFVWVEKQFHSTGEMQSLTLRRAVAIGAAQTLALIPGVSRSGITICAGMMLGLRRDQAARFSFLMASPLMLGAGLKKSMDLAGQPLMPGEMTALIVGIVTSAIGGWVVIRFLLNYLRRRGLHVFAWYRIALALVVLFFLLADGTGG
jgi:undecaprenyl-diphosphatase